MSESLMLETSKEYILFINFRDFELYESVSSFLVFFQKLFPKCLQAGDYRSVYTVFWKTFIISMLWLGYRNSHINLCFLGQQECVTNDRSKNRDLYHHVCMSAV